MPRPYRVVPHYTLLDSGEFYDATISCGARHAYVPYLVDTFARGRTCATPQVWYAHSSIRQSPVPIIPEGPPLDKRDRGRRGNGNGNG